MAGAASGGPQAFARVLTGFNYHGPDGQIVGDHDFGSISVVGRTPLVLDYEIKPEAVYSDGKPITCDDMVLAWASQSGRFPGFDAASRAGYTDIATVDCAPGQKKARVSFAQDRAFVDYGQLFAATSMMPSHVIADELGLGDGGVTTALLDNDGPVDRAHRPGVEHHLEPDTGPRPQTFPSSGPYKLDSVTEDGAVVLVANDKWWGAQPVTGKVTVWPRGADVQDRVNEGAYDVVDIAAGSSGTLNLPDDYVRTDAPSAGIEQLIFAPAGSARGGAGAAGAGAVHPARRDRPQRDGADRQLAAQPRHRGRLRRGRDAAGGRTVRRRQSRRRPRRAGRSAADRADRLPDTQRPAGRHRRCDRQVLRARQASRSRTSRERTSARSPLRDNEIDVLIASTGGAAGSGSTGSSAMDAYSLHSGNGNNLPRYANERIDGIIATLAVTSDPKELARLLGEAGPILWADMPTLPLYRQQRTLLTSTKMYAVSSNPTRWGAGWNMDRWELSQ